MDFIFLHVDRPTCNQEDSLSGRDPELVVNVSPPPPPPPGENFQCIGYGGRKISWAGFSSMIQILRIFFEKLL